MTPQKQVISGKTVYLVKTSDPVLSCRSCHFWDEHRNNYDLNNGKDCYETGRASVCQQRESKEVYVTPQRLRYHILELATKNLLEGRS